MAEGRQLTKKKEVLGIGVDLVDRKQTVEIIEKWIDGKKTRQVVTAYSEFFVTAQRDEAFRKVLSGADLVVPDGISVLGVMRYSELMKEARKYETEIPQQVETSHRFKSVRDDNAGLRSLPALSNIKIQVLSVVLGLQVGVEILKGNAGETVTGVWLVEELLRLASIKGWRVFLLGGYGDIAMQLKEKTLKQNSDLKETAIIADSGSENIEDASDDDQRRVIEKINKHQPDILLVAYGPVKQEKWIAKYKDQLRVKVAIGVGGTFDELGGRVKRVPKWFEERGLKWLGRWWWEPKRWRRIWNAVVVFPYLVWREMVGSR